MARCHQALANGALSVCLLCIKGRRFLHRGRGLERFFLAHAVSVVPGLLQLLGLLQVAELVVRDEQVASAI